MESTFPGNNRLGLSLLMDTNIVGDESEAVATLHQLHRQGWIELSKSDVVETELGDATGEKAKRLLSDARMVSEYMGPMVLGHSRLDASVLASEVDEERLGEVFALLHPELDRSTARTQHVRDAMQVANVVRYAKDALITRDRHLLQADLRIQERFRIRIWTPETAVAVASKRRKNYDIRNVDRHTGSSGC